jgi:cyclase
MEVAAAFGSQCMVLSIEAKRRRNSDGWEAYYDNGREHSGLDVVEWARHGESLGAGEILLTSIDAEGRENGMDINLIKSVSDAVNIPVIASGGCGVTSHIVDAAKAGASAVAIASIIHYRKTDVTKLKHEIIESGVRVRAWK